MTSEFNIEQHPGARFLSGAAANEFPHVSTIGEPAVLTQPLLALVCSRKCPGDVILKMFDVARALRDAGRVVIGGFHSPMEQEALDFLLRGTQSVILSPGRSLEGMRIRGGYRDPLAAGRLLLVSCFDASHRRITAALADRRNRFVCCLAGEVLVAHAAPGGKTEALAKSLLAAGRRVLTIDVAANRNLIEQGALPFAND